MIRDFYFNGSSYAYFNLAEYTCSYDAPANAGTGTLHDAGLGSQGSSGGSPNVGDPINAATGNKYLEDEDYADSPWLTLRRFYNSSGTYPAHIGLQWRHSFDRFLQIAIANNPTPTVYVIRPDGKQVKYTKSNGTWSTTLGSPDLLTETDNSNGVATGYTLFVAASRHYENYDANGVLQGVTNQAGQSEIFTYSTASTPATVAPAAGLLLTATDPQGRALQFTYNSSSQVSQITLPDGGTLTYTYDTSGNLSTVQYPDGKTRQYVYNEPSLTGNTSLPNSMTGIVDEAGVRYANTSYNSSGQSTSSGFAGNVGTTSVTYNSDGSAAVAYPLGSSVTLQFSYTTGMSAIASVNQPCGTQCGQDWQTRTYDANGYPASTTDFNGNVTATTYDANGLLDQQIDASGTSNQRTTVLTWNTTLRVPLTRTVSNASSTVVSNTQWVYSTTGQTLARCDIDPTNSAASGYACSNTGTVPAGVRRNTYTYCTTVGTGCPLVGLMLSATGSRTDLTQTTTYTYYTSSSAVNCGTPGAACYQPGDLYQVTDALGHVTTIASYDGNGRITRITDANGINTDMTYTPRGWLVSRTVGGAITRFTYTPYGAVQTVTDPDGVTTTYGYDTAHRLTKITDALGNYVQYTLDAAGDKTGEQVYDASGTVHKSLTRTFNPLGQLTSVVDGLSHTVFNATASSSYDANGNLIQSSDALGIQRQLGYDALNRLVQTLDNYNGTDPNTKNTTTAYGYDSLDRLTQVTDPSNLNTTYSYDGLSDATGQVSPDTGTTNRTFDAAGNVLTKTDAKGIVATNTYDALDRLSTTSYPDSTQNVTYSYDDQNSTTNCSTSYPVGRLTRIIEATVTTVYCYDARGNVIQKQQITATNTDTTGYSITQAGRLSGIVYPSGTLVSYTRDGDGRIQSISLTPVNGTASTAVSGVTYQPFGPVSGYTLGNGQQVTRIYDANYRLTDLTSPAFNLHVARDAMGDITAIGNAPGANPATETYAYDPLYRLLSVTEAGGSILESVTYNPTGDRLSKTGSGIATGTYTYNTGTHQLNATGNAVRSVDADGNTTAITETGSTYGFGYSNRNRMTLAQLGGNTIANYTYNAFDQRIQKITSSNAERYDYNEASQILGEYGATNRDYIWMDGIPVANVDTSGTTSTLAYVTADELGTPRVIANSSGITEWQLTYQGNPWGELAPASSGYTYNLRFPGQYADAETGLNSNVNRDFDSTTGRYIESDPIGLSGGPNTYDYVGGNPLSYSDPLGLQESCLNSAAAATCAAAGMLPESAAAGTGAGAEGASAGGAKVAAAVGGVAIGIAATALTGDENQNGDCGCGPDTRFEAYLKALAWAGMGIGDEGNPIPWSQYRGRGGPNYTYVRQNGGNNYGYESPNSPARVMNHPDGHPDQVGDDYPSHHHCPHFHSVNAQGKEMIFPYKRGT
ncbi:RHS repeat-associated core domain-containing protein [Dyella lipolytica]|uniref:RHS repeat-associated core domain-containing protein n=1 Tax=Dyella lipolytica TaxID=1867835 RepID=A0ABW8IUI0_9GAMM|nr:RHS repeat-associated core domain-containing protein [Dyella lipolytica]